MTAKWPLPATLNDSDEADRQMLLLAIAELGLRRPGWGWTLRCLATRLLDHNEFDGFQKSSADIVNPAHPQLCPGWCVFLKEETL